mmetsp:Transcript_160873/g.516295  ORF Transcript_160873/g.516295 Transcript_160873/m.516295 type:complete len:749 (-) Transcript_160873:129-2375(-)
MYDATAPYAPSTGVPISLSLQGSWPLSSKNSTKTPVNLTSAKISRYHSSTCGELKECKALTSWKGAARAHLTNFFSNVDTRLRWRRQILSLVGLSSSSTTGSQTGSSQSKQQGRLSSSAEALAPSALAASAWASAAASAFLALARSFCFCFFSPAGSKAALGGRCGARRRCCSVVLAGSACTRSSTATGGVCTRPGGDRSKSGCDEHCTSGSNSTSVSPSTCSSFSSCMSCLAFRFACLLFCRRSAAVNLPLLPLASALACLSGSKRVRSRTPVRDISEPEELSWSEGGSTGRAAGSGGGGTLSTASSHACDDRSRGGGSGGGGGSPGAATLSSSGAGGSGRGGGGAAAVSIELSSSFLEPRPSPRWRGSNRVLLAASCSWCLFVNHYSRDVTGALEREIETVVGIDASKFQALNSAYFVPNIVAPLVAGAFAQRFGATRVLVAMQAVAAVGHLVFGLGGQMKSYGALLAGRIILGLTYEAIDVMPLPILAPHFGEEWGVMVGLFNGALRMGSVANFALSPWAYHFGGLPAALWLSGLFGISGLAAALATWRFDLKAWQGRLPGCGGSGGSENRSSGTEDVGSVGEGELPSARVGCCGALQDNVQLILYVLTGALMYSAIVPFWFYGGFLMLVCVPAPALPPIVPLGLLGIAWASSNTLFWSMSSTMVPKRYYALGAGVIGASLNLGPSVLPVLMAHAASKGAALLLPCSAAGLAAAFSLLMLLPISSARGTAVAAAGAATADCAAGA